jgi:hypothetical protein
VRGAGSLTIVGTGIRLISQVTPEALAELKRAERLLYIAGDPASAAWLRKINPAAENLADAYLEGRPRTDTYREMTDRILRPVREGARVVAAFYGHPGVGVDPAHDALRQARAEGFPARMLPGISAEACLVADLGIDPLYAGWQSHEAWAFLERRPRFDPRVPLVLWQLGLIYQPSIAFNGGASAAGVADLRRLLESSYPPSHEVVLYEASPFPVADSRIERIPLRTLTRRFVRMGTTLFVPPRPARR